MGMSRVSVTIDKLILKNFEPDQRRPLVEALQGELLRMLANRTTRAAWTRPQYTPVIRLGGMLLDPGRSGSGRLGAGIARGVGEGLKR